jgi:hypothetical protein
LVHTLLIIVLAFLSLSGLGGGIGLLIDPSGAGIGVPLDLLDKLPISTFVLPGLYLLIVYGLGSLGIIIAELRGYSWATTATILLGLVLVGWIIGQVIVWGTPWFLQYLYFFVGVALILLGFLAHKQEA